MSVDRYLFAGTYLKIGKIKIKHDEPVIGCENCKTSNVRDKFCSHCGAPHIDYSKPATVNGWHGLLELCEGRGEIDGEDEQRFHETFMSSGNIITPLNNDVVGKMTEVNYDSVFLDAPVFNEDDAKNFYNPILEILDRYEVKYEFVTGVCFFCQ